jgi:hypothetical protein
MASLMWHRSITCWLRCISTNTISIRMLRRLCILMRFLTPSLILDAIRSRSGYEACDAPRGALWPNFRRTIGVLYKSGYVSVDSSHSVVASMNQTSHEGHGGQWHMVSAHHGVVHESLIQHDVSAKGNKTEIRRTRGTPNGPVCLGPKTWRKSYTTCLSPTWDSDCRPALPDEDCTTVTVMTHDVADKPISSSHSVTRARHLVKRAPWPDLCLSVRLPPSVCARNL